MASRRPSTVSTSRSGRRVRLDQARRARRRRGPRRGTPWRVRSESCSPRGPALVVEALVGGLDGRARPRRPRCSAPACARSSTGGRRGGSGRRSRCPGSRPAPSRGGCAGTRGRAGPSWRSRTTRARRRSRRVVGEHVLVGLVVVVGVAGGVVGQRRARLDGERVGATRGAGRARATSSSVRHQSSSDSPAAAVDEVEVEGVEARRPGPARRTRTTLAGSCVRPSAASTWGTIDCTPNESRFTPPAAVGVEQLRRDGVGVALDGDLGAVGPGDAVQHGDEVGGRHHRRRAAADEHAWWPAGMPSATRRSASARQRGQVRRRSGGRGRSRWRTRSSRSGARRTGCGRRRRRARRSRTLPWWPGCGRVSR